MEDLKVKQQRIEDQRITKFIEEESFKLYNSNCKEPALPMYHIYDEDTALYKNQDFKKLILIKMQD